MFAQPAWKTQTQRQYFQPITTVMESQPSQDDAESSSAAADVWLAPDGYQSSISTRRNADAARDAHHENDDLSDVDWLEHWRSTYQDTM